MSTSLDYLERVAARARREGAPVGDVSDRVIWRVAEKQARSFFGALAVCTAGYAAAAVAALLFAYAFAAAADDPLGSLIQTASVFTTM